MEMTTVAIWGSIGAVFCLIIGALYGHCRRERTYEGVIAYQRNRHVQWRASMRAERELLINEQYAREEKLIASHNEVLREMEISLAKAGESVELVTIDLQKMKNQWKYADRYRKALVETVAAHGPWNFDEDGSSPSIMLTMLMKYVAECAIDPEQNQKAKNLYVKGVRAGAKKGREQMRKLMQKSIDNQAATITNMYDTLAAAHTREDIYREAVSNTLTDKVGLVNVRRVIVQDIAAECARLRAVETKKGE